MDRFICIHGHFYQPPRENPWLEEIELQESATPFHDWNERITAECYDPNRASRILDESGAIADIINNYSKISFNFGPTLLSWLQRHSPATHDAIVAADHRSRDEFQGHGAALAQAWGHIILPLANLRDKRTQIIWGIKDFEHRFGRSPEGMWLPEAAVDLETLDLLAEHGLRFTLLSPFQARRIRKLDQREWVEVVNGTIDPRQPYLCRLPSGRTIAIFFYDGGIARDIAFGNLLKSGEDFADKLLAPFATLPAKQAQLVNVATDGESYGHHHRFGDMALAYALKKLNAKRGVALTVYGAFLERFPPRHEVEIIENSSWSCAHGIERWRGDCGCRIGLQAGWTQAWRAPLREVLDWLRDQLAKIYENYGGRIFPDPWKTRDAYIDVVLDRSPEQVQRFLDRQASRELSTEESRSALRLLEMQRHAMQMFTSCGWFFDEVSGIETVQLLAYAGRAIHLAEECCSKRLEDEFRLRLAQVPSNKPRWRDAGRIYDELVRPAKVDLARVAAHHAIATLFDLGDGRLYAYASEDISRRRVSSGRMELAVGRVHIRSLLTWDEDTFCYAVLHYGDHHVTAGVRKIRDDAVFADACEQLCTAFETGNLEQTLRLVDRHFGGETFTLSHLFKDEQQRIVQRIIRRQLDDILDHFRAIYEDHLALLRFLREIGMAIPGPLAAATEQIINDELLRILNDHGSDSGRMRELLAEADRFELKLDQPQLLYAAGAKSQRLLTDLAATPRDHAILRRAVDGLRLLRELPWAVDLWQAQNIYLDIRVQIAVEMTEGVARGDREAETWLDLFRQLGKLLEIRVPPTT